MKKDWEMKRLGEVIKLEYGKPLSDEKRVVNGSFPVYGANGLKGRSNVFYADKKTIIVGRKGSAGEINLTEEKFWPLDVTYFITFDERKYDLLFLFYLLTLLDLPKLAKGVKPGINRNEVYNLEVSIPTLLEQKRIVAVLDKFFATIDKAKANAEKNLKNAKELFESYFQGVFGEKEALTEARRHSGWEMSKLGEVCKFNNGAAHEQKIDDKGKYILVNSKFISSEGKILKRTNSALSPLSIGDIVFVMSDVPNGKALAKCFIIDKNDTYTLNQRIGAIRSKIFNDKFLYYQFNRHKHLLSFNNGENQTNLRKNDILNTPLLLPPLKEQQIIVRQLDALRAETQKLETVYHKKMVDLEELKKSILQKAFSGELTVKGAVKC